mgnify:CR=1 FL=1
MGVTKNDSTMKSEADQAQRKNLEAEIQQGKNEKSSTAGKKSNGKDTGTYKERLKEITAVLHKHAITRGVSPEKLRLILTDLGPTFIKLGQIMSMRSDILPKRYCDELMKLCSDVDPMPFAEVEEVLREAFGCPWQEEFQEIQEKPLGSASIAQVHRAVLKTGEEVVIKVQRKGIYEIMARDIGLMKKAVKLLPPVSIKEAVDLNLVLEELWRVTQEEMNFLTEAANMEEFSRKIKKVAFVEKHLFLYREYTTASVLVMEYIDGIPIDHKEELLAGGYDLDEIGSKFVDNFIKQVMDDGFFHADPHPGNVMIQGGKIVWIDMGMMGRLNDRDRELIGQAIEGVALNDIGKIQDAVLALGEFKGKPNQSRLYTDIRDLMAKYGTADFGEIDIVEILTDLMDVMKENKIVMPHGLTMLARGLTHMEGVLADISPEINMVQIAAARLKGNLLEEGNWKKQMKGTGKKAVPLHAPCCGYSCAGSRFPAGLHEGPDQDQSGPSRIR